MAAHLDCRWLICVTAVAAEAETGRSEAPAGFVAATPEGECLHIHELSVHPSHGRRGLGRRLLRFCETRARRQRFRWLTLTTFADIPWNAPFYRRFGFSDCDTPPASSHLAMQLEVERAAGLTQRIAMQLRL